MNLRYFFESRFPQISQLVFVILLIYVLVILSRSVYKNYQTNRRVVKLEEEVAHLEEEKGYLENLVVYYQSVSFKELEARRQLNLKKSGEKVMAVETEDVSEDKRSLEDIYSGDFQLDTLDISTQPQSNVDKWRQFLFGK